MHPNSPTVDNWIAMSYMKKGMTDEMAGAQLRWHSAIYGFDAASQNSVLAAYSVNGLPGFWRKLRELVRARAAMNVHATYHLSEINAFAGDIDEDFPDWTNAVVRKLCWTGFWISHTPLHFAVVVILAEIWPLEGVWSTSASSRMTGGAA